MHGGTGRRDLCHHGGLVGAGFGRARVDRDLGFRVQGLTGSFRIYGVFVGFPGFFKV